MLIYDQHLYKSPAIVSMVTKISIALTEGALLIFLQSRVEKLLAWHLGSQSGAL